MSDFASCHVCGAMVLSSNVPVHDEWHDKLAVAVERAGRWRPPPTIAKGTGYEMPTDEQRLNTQIAPYPTELEELVGRLRYRPGWRFFLHDRVRDHATSHGGEARGLTFMVLTHGYDAYHPEIDNYSVYHYFPVPAATYNRASWQRWLLDCLLRVELHEACEFFALAPVPCGCNPNHLAPQTSDEEAASEVTCEHGNSWRHNSAGYWETAQRSLSHPYAPTHGPGDDPYVVHEYASDEQRRTRFTGEVLP